MPGKVDWADIEVFVAFARARSMSDAARSLGIDETTISRRIKKLGQALGNELVTQRNGRAVLSEAGAALVPGAEAMADSAIGMSRAAETQLEGPTGAVRVTAIRAILGRVLVPSLPELAARYPGLALHLIGESRNLNLSRRESDVAIRLAMPTGSELTTRKLANIGFGLYLRRDREPEQSPWITYSEELGHLPEAQWVEIARAGRPVAATANGVEILTSVALSGAGLAVLPCFVGDREPLLRRVEAKPVVVREAWLAVHADDRRSPRVRAAMSFIIERFEADAALLAGECPGLP
jgi:DNA-binding transcriptional LysR family regulator